MESLSHSCVERWAPRSSGYFERLTAAKGFPPHHEFFIQAHIGVLKALLEDVKNDRLRTFEEIVHASLFDDFLGQSQHLLEKGYRQAAAVIAGGVLEEHIRALATKFNIPIGRQSKNGLIPKSAADLNNEIYKNGAYAQTDRSLVQGWLDLRNEAAHNKPVFKKRTEDEVSSMIQGVRSLISRVPA